MSTSNPDAFVNDTTANFAMTAMLANLVGTDSIFVRVQLVKVVRRLSASAPWRRLQAANVNLQYSVLVPATASSSPAVDSVQGTMATVQVSTLGTLATAALNTYAGGRFQVTVTSVTAPTIILPTTTSTTTTSQTTTFTVTKFATVTKTTTTTSTKTTTVKTTSTVTTTTAVPGAPTETSTTLTSSTATITITAPPPPAAVAAPPAPCTDLATFRDVKGLACQDWTGVNCSIAAGYSADALAAVRANCPVACGFCAVAPPFVVKEVKKVASALSLAVDLSQMDEDTRSTAMRACVTAALGVPLSNIVSLEVVEDASRRLAGGTPSYKVKYEVVVPPSKQLRDIIMQATSLSVPGSDSLSMFSQVMSDGFGVDTSTMVVEVTSKPVAQSVSIVLDGDEVVGSAEPEPSSNAGVSGSSLGGIVVASCADEAQFVDEQGESCSGWVGLECNSPKWLRTERPYTAKGLRSVQESCPLACGKCAPPGRQTFDQLNEQCIDDPLVAGWCARWRGLNCSSAPDLGYSPRYSAMLLDRCPQSCGMCPASAVACTDAPGFMDEQGQPCESWKGSSCTKEYAGYTRKGMLEIQSACPASCGFCGGETQVARSVGQQPSHCQDKPDYTYLQQFGCRDFVARTCTYATLYLEPRWLLGPHAVSAWHRSLWSACPVSCAQCDPQGRPTPSDLFIECEDDEYLAEWCAMKWRGQDCHRWENSVRLVVAGEAPKYNATLLGRCPETCGLCTKPVCGDGTYRDRVAHACGACQPGRHAVGNRSAMAARECMLARPGFSVPEAAAVEETPCGEGTFTNVSGQAQCSNCSAGTYAAMRGMSACIPCAVGWYQDAQGATECLRCLEGTYAAANGTITCDRCPFDFTTPLQASTVIGDCVCPPGTYMPFNTTGGCRDCPLGISCPGGHAYVNESFDDTPVLMEGVMSLPEDPFSAYTCTASDACLSERSLPYTEDAMLTVCPDLTSGPRCWDCPNNGTGAFHDDDGTCQPCGDTASRAWKTVAFVLLQLFGTWNLYRQEGAVQSGAKIMFLAAFGFMQVLMALSQIPLDWPTSMDWLLNVLVYFGYDGVLSSLFDFRTECYFGAGLLPRVLRDVCLPLLPFVNFALIGAVNKILRRETAWGAVANVVAGMYFGFFVNLALMALQLFPGEQMPNGKFFLVAFPGVEVGSPEWKQGVPVSIVAVAVYCVLFMAYCIHAIIVAPTKTEDEFFMESRDWMVGETNPQTFWWPLVDLIYGFGIALIQALSPNVYFDIYLEMVVLLGYTMMVIYYQPCTFTGVNHTNVALNVGLLVFMAFSTEFIDTMLVDQAPNRASFGIIMFALLWCLIAYVLFQVVYALYWRCTTSELELNIKEAHHARIMMQSLILFTDPQFIGELGPEKLWDPDLAIWHRVNKMLVPVFLHQQPGPNLLSQRIMRGKHFQVFCPKECRRLALTASGKGEVGASLEEAARLTKLTKMLAVRVLRPLEQQEAQPGPIVSHAANRVERSRWTQDFLVQVLPEVPAAHAELQTGGPDAPTSLASVGLTSALKRLERGRSTFGRSIAQSTRVLLHECGATLVDEEAFVGELKDLAGMPEAELREVYHHLDVKRQGQLKASHIVTALMMLGDIKDEHHTDDEASPVKMEGGHSQDEGYGGHKKHHRLGKHSPHSGSRNEGSEGSATPHSAASGPTRQPPSEEPRVVEDADHLLMRDAIHLPGRRSIFCSFPFQRAEAAPGPRASAADTAEVGFAGRCSSLAAAKGGAEPSADVSKGDFEEDSPSNAQPEGSLRDFSM